MLRMALQKLGMVLAKVCGMATAGTVTHCNMMFLIYWCLLTQHHENFGVGLQLEF